MTCPKIFKVMCMKHDNIPRRCFGVFIDNPLVLGVLFLYPLKTSGKP